jgi:hypothetical protein
MSSEFECAGGVGAVGESVWEIWLERVQISGKYFYDRTRVLITPETRILGAPKIGDAVSVHATEVDGDTILARSIEPLPPDHPMSEKFRKAAAMIDQAGGDRSRMFNLVSGIDIEKQREADAWERERPALTHQLAWYGDHARGQILAIRFEGTYPAGAYEADFAERMATHVNEVLMIQRPAALILDLSKFHYVGGQAINAIGDSLTLNPSTVRVAAIVADGETGRALQPLLGSDLPLGRAGLRLFASVAEATTHIRTVLDAA